MATENSRRTGRLIRSSLRQRVVSPLTRERGERGAGQARHDSTAEGLRGLIDNLVLPSASRGCSIGRSIRQVLIRRAAPVDDVDDVRRVGVLHQEDVIVVGAMAGAQVPQLRKEMASSRDGEPVLLPDLIAVAHQLHVEVEWYRRL